MRAVADVAQPRDHREDRALAAARVADDGDEFALRNLRLKSFTITAGPFGRRIRFAELGEFAVGAHVGHLLIY